MVSPVRPMVLSLKPIDSKPKCKKFAAEKGTGAIVESRMFVVVVALLVFLCCGCDCVAINCERKVWDDRSQFGDPRLNLVEFCPFGEIILLISYF